MSFMKILSKLYFIYNQYDINRLNIYFFKFSSFPIQIFRCSILLIYSIIFIILIRPSNNIAKYTFLIRIQLESDESAQKGHRPTPEHRPYSHS